MPTELRKLWSSTSGKRMRISHSSGPPCLVKVGAPKPLKLVMRWEGTVSSTQTGTKTANSMGPTQTGVVAGCQQFYTVQSGDSCYNIETTYGITFTQFFQWNPSGMSPVLSALSSLRDVALGRCWRRTFSLLTRI